MGVGAATVTTNLSLQFKLSPTLSIFSAEVFALYKALQHINSWNIPKALIITVTLSTLLNLKHIYPQNPIQKMIKSELLQAQENSRCVNFICIPSHIGIKGNEKADVCARSGISNDEPESECC